jgi:hypothetical protein
VISLSKVNAEISQQISVTKLLTAKKAHAEALEKNSSRLTVLLNN